MLLMWGTPARPASPAGGSILVTSAPRSLSILVQCGPASTRVKSITRKFCSGAFISVSLEDGRAGTGSQEGGQSPLLVFARPHLVVCVDLLGVGTADTVTRREICQRFDSAERDGRAGSELARPRH